MSLPTPITRKEAYLAAIAGETVQVPEKPITREEAYLAAIAEGGGGGKIIVDPVPTQGSENAVSSGGTYTALEGKLDASEKGTASGVAELDANGKVLSSQLPSFVDDVVEGYYDSETDRFYEESTFEHVIDPVGGKSWVDIPANKSYRWTGTVYVRVDEGVQLGETSNSAFRGDWGKALKDTMGTGTLDTTAQTVIPAINELNTNKATTTDITNAINALDVSSVGGTGKYISAISEADGKISATSRGIDNIPIVGSPNPVKSDGIFNAINESVSLKTATGNPITLTDAANANAEELLMAIEPVQSGSGDPSPTNVRPISGISEAVVNRLGKNLLEDVLVGYNITSTGYVEVNASYSLGVAKVVSGQSYIVTTNDGSGFVGGFYYDKPTDGSIAFDNTRYVIANKQFTAPITGYVVFRFTPDYTTPQIELGSTSTDYEAPVTPATATITLGQTVYGGSVNFKTGEVTVTHANIASYNGESINEPWLSSLDKYESGATPTTGAQVVYPLSTPVTLTLTPAELELLKGNNTITANGAEISIEYYPDNAIGALAEKLIDVQKQINGKQDALTFDSTPTAGSNNPVTSDGVHEAIAGLDTRVTALEGDGVFEMLTNDRVNTPQTEESKTMTVTRGGAGIFNAANDDIKYLWFVFIADGSNIGVDLPGPICIPRAFFTDQKTNFTYRALRCDVEIRRGEGENRIIWNWTFDNAEALPSEAYRYRIYVTN